MNKLSNSILKWDNPQCFLLNKIYIKYIFYLRYLIKHKTIWKLELSTLSVILITIMKRSKSIKRTEFLKACFPLILVVAKSLNNGKHRLDYLHKIYISTLPSKD